MCFFFFVFEKLNLPPLNNLVNGLNDKKMRTRSANKIKKVTIMRV